MATTVAPVAATPVPPVPPRSASPAGASEHIDGRRPRLSVEDVDTLVSRLTKTNTTTAKKAVLWSTPRLEYEHLFKNTANLKTSDCYWERYSRITKHYPGAWRVANEEETGLIVARLSKPTVAHVKLAEVNINRRIVIEEHKRKMLGLDIGIHKDKRERLHTPRYVCSAAPVRADSVCERRSARARSAPFHQWKST